MALNFFLLASGLLVLGLGVFHSVLGEIYLVRRLLRRENLPKLFGGDSFTKLTIRYAWHLLTVFCVACAAILFLIAKMPAAAMTPVVWILAGAFTVSGTWGAIATRGRHLSWIALVVAGGLAAAGAS